MGWEASRIKKEKEKGDRRVTILLNFAEARFRYHSKKIREEYPDESQQEVYADTVDRLLSGFKVEVPGKEDKINDLAETISGVTYKDEEDFIESASRQLVDFLVANFTFQEMEDISRRGDSMALNRLVEYTVEGDEVYVHIPVTFLDNPNELKSLFSDALRKLAEKMETDPELVDVKSIKARSWIIFKAQRTIQDFGFTITELDEDKMVGLAEISREKLLEIYKK